MYEKNDWRMLKKVFTQYKELYSYLCKKLLLLLLLYITYPEGI